MKWENENKNIFEFRSSYYPLQKSELKNFKKKLIDIINSGRLSSYKNYFQQKLGANIVDS